MNFKKIIFIFLVIGCVFVVPGPDELQQLTSAVKPSFVMVIDAGHGGPDGGAEAADGTQEKRINLSIAKALKKEAEKYGVTVILTREGDAGLYEADNTEQKWKKLGDLKERKRIIDETEVDVAVSIHLNSFWSDTNVHGAQVFYPKTGEARLQKDSEALAGMIQDSLIKGIDDGSNRIEMAKDDIYLFEDITCPTVLVECGFLSNPGDAENLKKEEFHEKLSQYIMEAVAQKFSLTRQNIQKIST